VTGTIPDGSIRERIGDRELPAYVTEALVHQDRIDRHGSLRTGSSRGRRRHG